jgi:antitoxin component YwqK of YwqJK toxin-antitoxin module
MKKTWLILFLFCFIEMALSVEEPQRPKSIPREAKWNIQDWHYYDQKNNILYHWHSNGKLKSKGSIDKNGLLQGAFEVWGDDGVKLLKFDYDHGKIVNKINCIIRFPDVQRPLNIPPQAIWNSKREKWTFFDFEKKTAYGWYMNGEKFLEGQVINEKLEGKNSIWYQNGNIMQETEYKHDLKDGLQINFDINGKKEIVAYYKNDKLIWKSNYNKKIPSNLPQDSVWDEKFKGWKYITGRIANIIFNNGKHRVEIPMDGYDYNGPTKTWLIKTGKICVTGQWDKSSKEGEWKFINEDGDLLIRIYKNDKLIEEKEINNVKK